MCHPTETHDSALPRTSPESHVKLMCRQRLGRALVPDNTGYSFQGHQLYILAYFESQLFSQPNCVYLDYFRIFFLFLLILHSFLVQLKVCYMWWIQTFLCLCYDLIYHIFFFSNKMALKIEEEKQLHRTAAGAPAHSRLGW